MFGRKFYFQIHNYFSTTFYFNSNLVKAKEQLKFSIWRIGYRIYQNN